MNYSIKRKIPKIGIKSNSKGFTLVELLVTIVIISIISSLIISSAARAQKYARDAQRKSDLKKLQGALQQYYTDQGFYPNAWILDENANVDLDDCTARPKPPCIVTKTYLKQVPHEPTDKYNPKNTPNHYCYLAQVSVSDPTNNYNTTHGSATNPANCSPTASCQYYKLFANLETGTMPIENCADGTSNHNRNFIIDGF